MKTALTSRMLLSACLLTGAWAVAQDSSQQPAPDNTKVNQRDRDSSQPTADRQKDNRSDREITQQIRQAVMKDSSLSSSSYAFFLRAQCENCLSKWDGHVEGSGEVRRGQAIDCSQSCRSGWRRQSNQPVRS